LRLTTPPHDLIVVDDASSDGSPEILAQYRDSIRFLPLEKNHGKGGARNAGAALATGDYLVFLDGDDVLLPWALDVYGRVAGLKAPKLFLCAMKWFRGDLAAVPVIGKPPTIEMVEYSDCLRRDRQYVISASALVVERNALRRAGGWGDLKVNQDQDLLFKLGDSGCTVQILSPPTTLHRQHPNQSINYIPPYIDAMLEMRRKHRKGEYPGGPSRRFDRAALLGGLAVYWIKRSCKARLYTHALRLFVYTWPLIFAAIVHRSHVLLKGRLQTETVEV